MKQSKQLDPIHPGEIPLEEFMKPLGISNQLARDLDVPPNRISAIVNGSRSITADTALRLCTYFNVSPETWLGLQIDYDLRLPKVGRNNARGTWRSGHYLDMHHQLQILMLPALWGSAQSIREKFGIGD